MVTLEIPFLSNLEHFSNKSEVRCIFQKLFLVFHFWTIIFVHFWKVNELLKMFSFKLNIYFLKQLKETMYFQIFYNYIWYANIYLLKNKKRVLVILFTNVTENNLSSETPIFIFYIQMIYNLYFVCKLSLVKFGFLGFQWFPQLQKKTKKCKTCWSHLKFHFLDF